jgi:lysophospholipase L1-like esterase
MKRLLLASAALLCSAAGAFAQVSIAPNNAAILYSPYNWNVASGSATTINAGAYFRTLFSGSSVTLNFNVSLMGSPASELYYRIDGHGPWTATNVAATVVAAMPTDTTAAAYHLLEFVVKSTTETINRWNAAATGTAVVFTGLTLANGAVILAPAVLPCNVLFYGDSITETVRTVNATAANDTDRNDALQGWARFAAQAMGCEFGIVGFGASGLTVTGSGSVPPLGTSYSLLYAGAPRSFFSPSPDLIALNEGTNDSGATASAVQAAMNLVLQNLLTAASPKTKIVVMRPFNGSQAGALQAAVSSVNSVRVEWLDTTGFFNPAYGSSDGTHPLGSNALGFIGPQVAAALNPILRPHGKIVGYRPFPAQ